MICLRASGADAGTGSVLSCRRGGRASLVAHVVGRRQTLPPPTRLHVRHRTLTTGEAGRQSVETEIGADKFHSLRQKLNESPSLRILDVAGGEGLTGKEIASRWPQHRVTTLDLHPPAATLPAVRGDAQCLPFATGTFDIVLCVQLLQYVPDKLHVLREVYRILKRRARPGSP